MQIHNRLPLLLDCLNRWENPPTRAQFEAEYAKPMADVAGRFFEDYHSVLSALDWSTYRGKALQIDSEKQYQRVLNGLKSVEELFGFKLDGEIILQGSFEEWDGFARFEKGSHRVFLGMDEFHSHDYYLDILIAHELTHVARESRPSVWEGFGLNPKMPRREYLENQPIIEHLFGEGFSCVASELLVPGKPAWAYTYQTEESFLEIQNEVERIDRAVKKELTHPDQDYSKFYRIHPLYSHYTWAWNWSKALLKEFVGGDPRQLVGRCSKDFLEHALAFKP